MCGANKLKGEEKRDGIAALCAAGKTAGAPLHNSRQLDATGGRRGHEVWDGNEVIRQAGSKPRHRRSK